MHALLVTLDIDTSRSDEAMDLLKKLVVPTIKSGEGPMTPRNIGAARRLRETRSVWQARLNAMKKGGS